eukprot:3612997-Alexandrium_andersonii.AAC.1
MGGGRRPDHASKLCERNTLRAREGFGALNTHWGHLDPARARASPRANGRQGPPWDQRGRKSSAT